MNLDLSQEEFGVLVTAATEDIGRITSLFLKTTEQEIDGERVTASLGNGFVNFETHTSAVLAIERLNNADLVKQLAPELPQPGKVLCATQAVSKSKRKKEGNDARNLYVKNIAETVTEERLREAFSAFGNITSLKIALNDAGVSRGFGFISFQTLAEGRNAITMGHNMVLEGKSLYVAFHQPKETRQQQLKQHFQRTPTNGPRGTPMLPMRVPMPAPIPVPNGPSGIPPTGAPSYPAFFGVVPPYAPMYGPGQMQMPMAMRGEGSGPADGNLSFFAQPSFPPMFTQGSAPRPGEVPVEGHPAFSGAPPPFTPMYMQGLPPYGFPMGEMLPWGFPPGPWTQPNYPPFGYPPQEPLQGLPPNQ